MITLQPIAKNIQSTLYEKIEMMKKRGGSNLDPENNRPYIIGESVTSNSDINLNYMMARTPWLRMVSLTPASENNDPIILMGGELNSAGIMASAFSTAASHGMHLGLTGGSFSEYDIFHDRGGKYSRSSGAGEGEMPYRPLPGVKDASIEYKGGGMKLGATRTAEINWTCWTWEELDRLTPHFLDAGRSVLLEWGWSGIGKLINTELLNIFEDGNEDNPVPNHVSFDKKKIKNLNQNILAHIQQQNGHYDAVLGLIQDFTWDVNETGGFDCTTTLVAQGVSMISANERQKTSRGDKFANLPLVKGDDLENPELSKLAPYISYQDYMEDFHNQILASNQSKQAAIFTTYAQGMLGLPGVGDNRASNLGTHGGGVYVSWGYFEDNVLSRFLSSITRDKKVVGEFRSIEQATNDKGALMFHSKEAVIKHIYDPNLVDLSEGTEEGATYVDSSFFTSWGETDEVNDSSDPEKISYVRYLPGTVVDKENPVMDSTRLTNCRYLITTDSSKWVIPNKEDPFLSSDQITTDITIAAEDRYTSDPPCVNQSWIGGADSDWTKYFDTDRAGKARDKISENPVIQHFAPRIGYLGSGEFDPAYMPIRNIFFNVDYLQRKCKGSGNLMKVVEDIWNDFSDEYGGVYKFKIEFDDNTNRLVVREEGYSRYDVEKLNETLLSKDLASEDAGDLVKMNNPLFEFPTMEQGSIVKTQTVSAKLPDRMKQAAMYGQRAVATGTDTQNEDIIRGGTYDDIAGLAWGRMAEALANPPDEEMSENERKNKRYADMMSGDVDYPSRGNRAFGNLSASPDSPLIIGDIPPMGTGSWTPEPTEGAASILTSITAALNTSQQKYLVNRKKRIKKGTTSTVTTTKNDVKVEEVITEVDELQKTFKSFSATGTVKVKDEEAIAAAGTLNQFIGNGIYELKKYKTSGEGDGHCWSIKPEAHSLLDRLLRGSPDGILKNINPLIPIDFEMEIDGTGGMFPGNSFHSAYLGGAYKNQSLFQMVGVNHTIDSSGWTTAIKGQIRAQSVLTKGESHEAKREDAAKTAERLQKEREDKAAELLEVDKTNCVNAGGEWDDSLNDCVYPETEPVKVDKSNPLDDELMEIVIPFFDKPTAEKYAKGTDSTADDKLAFMNLKREVWGKLRPKGIWIKTAAYSSAWASGGQNDDGKFIRWFNRAVKEHYKATESESPQKPGKQNADNTTNQGGYDPLKDPNLTKEEKIAILQARTRALFSGGTGLRRDKIPEDGEPEFIGPPVKNIGTASEQKEGRKKGQKKSEGGDDKLAERTKKANSYTRHVATKVMSKGEIYEVKILEINMPGTALGKDEGSLDIEGPFRDDGPPDGGKDTKRFVSFEKYDRFVKRYNDSVSGTDDDEDEQAPTTYTVLSSDTSGLGAIAINLRDNYPLTYGPGGTAGYSNGITYFKIAELTEGISGPDYTYQEGQVLNLQE